MCIVHHETAIVSCRDHTHKGQTAGGTVGTPPVTCLPGGRGLDSFPPFCSRLGDLRKSCRDVAWTAEETKQW